MNWFTATDPSMPYYEQDVNTVVGSGPYYISSREVGRTLVLDRNKNYKGSRPANPDRIVVTVGGDQNQSILQVKAGQADYEPLVPSAAAGALGEEFGVNKGRFFVKPTSVTSYWALNSLPGPAPGEREAPPGDQLGDRPAGAGAGCRQVRWPPDVADPPARDARVPAEQQHLRVQRRERRQGQGGRRATSATCRCCASCTATRPRTSTAARSCGSTSRRWASRRRPSRSRARSSSRARGTRRATTTSWRSAGRPTTRIRRTSSTSSSTGATSRTRARATTPPCSTARSSTS